VNNERTEADRITPLDAPANGAEVAALRVLAVACASLAEQVGSGQEHADALEAFGAQLESLFRLHVRTGWHDLARRLRALGGAP
jgi:hypothetical protein